MLISAFQSSQVYVSRCHYFIALCPVLSSPDKEETFSDYTWSRISFPWSLQGHECSCRFDSETTGAGSWGGILHSGAGTTRCCAVGIFCSTATKRGDTHMVGPLLASLRFSKWGLADSELAGSLWRLNCDYVVQVDVSWNNNNNYTWSKRGWCCVEQTVRELTVNQGPKLVIPRTQLWVILGSSVACLSSLRDIVFRKKIVCLRGLWDGSSVEMYVVHMFI